MSLSHQTRDCPPLILWFSSSNVTQAWFPLQQTVPGKNCSIDRGSRAVLGYSFTDHTYVTLDTLAIPVRQSPVTESEGTALQKLICCVQMK